MSNLNDNYNLLGISLSGQQRNNDVQLDITDKYSVDNFCKESQYFNILVFLVGLAHKKGNKRQMEKYKNVNYNSLVNLLSSFDKVEKIPEKVIFASTISVYGERLNINNYNEKLLPEPSSPYAITKLKAEQYLLDKFADKSWILRFAPVYSSDFLLNINRRTRIGNTFYKVGNGSKKLSLCNIKNIETVIKGIIKDKVPAGIYNLSDSREYTYNELLPRQNIVKVLHVPIFIVKFLYYIGKLINNTFLKENTVKLISDNIFTSEKIRSFIDLPATKYDVQFDYD